MAAQTPMKPTTHYGLLALGVVLILIPLAIAIWFPDAYGRAQPFMRVVAAVGAGLAVGFMPGTLQAKFPKVVATGGAAAFVIVLMYDPIWKLEERRQQRLTEEARERDRREQQVLACVARAVSNYEAPRPKPIDGGASAPGPGPGGRTKHASAPVCVSVGPDQSIISAGTEVLSCHGGRCSVTAPEISPDGKSVCVTAKAWSESKPFGGGGSGKYRLTAQYKDLATPETRNRFEAQCRAESPVAS